MRSERDEINRLTDYLLSELKSVYEYERKAMKKLRRAGDFEEALATYEHIAHTVYSIYNDYYISYKPDLRPDNDEIIDDILNDLRDIYEAHEDKQIDKLKQSGDLAKAIAACKDLIDEIEDVYSEYNKLYKKSLKTK